MPNGTAARLDTSHTWDEMAAFIRACPAHLSALLVFRDSGRMQIHYATRKGTIVAQAVCTLTRGWVYGLPAGIAPGIEAATAACAGWNIP